MFIQKNLRKLDKELTKGTHFYSESDEMITINVKAETHDQIFSEYNYENKTTLNPNLCEYLWDNIKLAPPSKDVTIRIYDKANLNLPEVQSAIKTHYRREYADAKDDLKKINLFTIIAMIVGVLFLVSLVLIHNYVNNYYLDIILEIVSWVFIWEAVDRFFLERPKIRKKCIQIQKIYAAKVVLVK